MSVDWRPGALAGLPAGLPDVVYDLGYFRYLLVGLVVVWAATILRGRVWQWVLVGTLFTSVATGFWVLALARPYGLLEDAGATRFAAQAALVGPESFLAGEPAEAAPSPLARRVLGPRALLLLPSFLPLLLVPLLALALACSGERHAAVGALLWLAFSTGELDTLHGLGLIPGSWTHPEAALWLTLVVVAHLLAGRLDGTAWGWPRGLLLFALCCWLAGSGVERGILERVFALTLDQGLWLGLGGLGLLRGASGSARALVGAGALACWLPGDAWSGHALFRLGLLLAATGPVAEGALKLAALAPALPAGWRAEPMRIGLALGLLAAVPGSFLFWWDPVRLDPVAKASLEPVSGKLQAVLTWIAEQTPADAVFIASPDYAPAVAALAGRRVLQAPSLAIAPDDERRTRLRRQALSPAGPGPLAERYGLRYLLVAPGDFKADGLVTTDALDVRPQLALRLSAPGGFRVYEFLAGPAAAGPGERLQ